MKYERERRFLISDRRALKVACEGRDVVIEDILQGYLTPGQPVVRVRVSDSHGAYHPGIKRGYLTIKGKKVRAKAPEYEYKIPAADAEDLMRMACAKIKKRRFHIRFDGGGVRRVWHVDVFTGRHKGLVIAEIEFRKDGEKIALPPWAGKEITTDKRYSNLNLALNGVP